MFGMDCLCGNHYFKCILQEPQELVFLCNIVIPGICDVNIAKTNMYEHH